jgi:HAE1 family hydrophobic/amphiphilic exporter-1
MNLPKYAVNRPITAAMAFIAVLLFGLVSFRMLPLDVMPEMELPSLTVITVYPGASAEEIEKQLVKPLEAVLAGTEHLKEIQSSSRENVSFIALKFEWGTDISAAANNARDLMELVKAKLPAEAHTPIIYKMNSSMIPVLIYGITAEENYDGIEQIVEDQVASALRKVAGVGTVVYLGQPEREIQISLDPMKLQAYHVSAQQIATLLQAANRNIPGGTIKTGTNDFSLAVSAEFEAVEEIGELVITAFQGRIVRLRDLAEIKDGFREKDEFARNKAGIGMALMVQKQSGLNTLDVIEAVRARMDLIRNDLPADVDVFEVIASDEVITQSVSNLTSSLWYAFIFVIFVVLFFLREWRSSLIIILTIPFSLITAFITMYAIGYTINIFSLMALVIAIGMVVDNAIVVLENITRHIENGSKPKQAAIFAASEMGMAILASTITTLVVFIPLIFTGGVVGIMFKQLAVITSVTMLASLITALSLTPMLSSKMLQNRKKNNQPSHSWFFRKTESVFTSVEKVYRELLNWSLSHKTLNVSIFIGVLIISLYFGKRLGSDYIPEFDAGDVAIVFETEVGTTAAETDRISKKIMDLFEAEVPELVPGTLVAITGQTQEGLLTAVGFSEGKNVSTILGHLSLPDQRERSAKEIGEALRIEIAQIPEVEKFHVTAGSLLSAAITGNKKPVELEISGNDLQAIGEVATAIRAKMESMDFFADVTSTNDEGKMELQVMVDKEKAARMGLNATMIGLQIRHAIYGFEAGSYTEQGEDYPIVLRYTANARNEVEQIGNIMLTNMLNQQIPLSTVAHFEQTHSNIEIQRKNQERIVFVKADVKNISLGEAAQSLEAYIQQLDIPAGIDVRLGGQLTEKGDAFDDLYLILILGVLLVYMVMAAQFESLTDPFIIMLALPFTVIGVVWAFQITGLTLSVTTFIGVIMLVGIVVNNGIVLVDYINLLRKRGLALNQAVSEAGKSRLRPVLMTTLTTILAMLPMAMSQGMGREMFSPLGITVIGGLSVSTLITLVFVPVVYTLFHQKNFKN